MLVDVLLNSVKYVIKPYYMMALVKNSRAITRQYTKNLDMRHVFEHVRILTGTYHKKDCTCCHTIGVDRDVNAVENIRRTSAVSRYGRQVSASLGEVRRGVDVILDPTPLIQGCWSNWADRLSRMAGV